MKCWYCNTELGEPHYHGQPAPVLLHCNRCPRLVEYDFAENSVVYRVTFRCIVNGKICAICIEPTEETKFAVYLEKGNCWYPLVKAPTIPNINPKNAEEKVRTYLIFS